MKAIILKGAIIVTIFMVLTACNKQSEKGSSDTNKSNTSTNPNTEREEVTIPRASPSAFVKQTIGLSTVSISYSRPSVISPEGIDRTGRIWGRLVPYDFNSQTISSQGEPIPWRAGANENTVITFSHDAKVEGKPIEAGKYGLHMAVHKGGGATVIFSNNADAWGSFSYDPSEDALRVEAETRKIPHTERLIYTIRDIDKTEGKIMLDWERKRIKFDISFDTHKMVLDNFRNKMSDTTGLTWVDYNRAANYCADNSVNLEEGLSWAENSLNLKESYQTLSTKAQILKAMGRESETRTVKLKALNLASTTADDIYSFGTNLIQQGRLDSARQIYQRLRDQWPGHWLGAHGTARWHSAKGNYEQAIKLEEKALAKAPDPHKGFIKWAITKLENGVDFNY